jgi:hypothetical protein
VNLFQLAKFSGMGQVCRQLKILNAAALRAGLIHSAISGDTVGKHPTLFDGHTAWFLTVDIFTRFGGQDRSKRMPAIAGRDENGVDVVTFQDVVHISIDNTIVIPVVLVDHRLHSLATSALQVGGSDHLHIGILEKPRKNVRASVSDTDSSKRNSFTWRDRSISSEHVGGDNVWNRERTCCPD